MGVVPRALSQGITSLSFCGIRVSQHEMQIGTGRTLHEVARKHDLNAFHEVLLCQVKQICTCFAGKESDSLELRHLQHVDVMLVVNVTLGKE